LRGQYSEKYTIAKRVIFVFLSAFADVFTYSCISYSRETLSKLHPASPHLILPIKYLWFPFRTEHISFAPGFRLNNKLLFTRRYFISIHRRSISLGRPHNLPRLFICGLRPPQWFDTGCLMNRALLIIVLPSALRIMHLYYPYRTSKAITLNCSLANQRAHSYKWYPWFGV
jgi:hypothetical protein